MGYLPLEEYGLVGNVETCALVSSDGSVDWLCLPSLGSPSVFAALLDDEDGGRFALRPAGEYESEQSYIEDSNVLQTAFDADGGRLVLTDFMPLRGRRYPDDVSCRAVFRRVTCESGRVELEADFRPRFDYARADTTLAESPRGVVARSDDESALLATDRAFDVGEDAAVGRWSLEADETAWFVLQYDARSAVDPARNERVCDRTVDFWQEWTNTCNHPRRCFTAGPYHDWMERSALVLKLLFHWETDAIAAAPTTSLPEDVGGVRNWDYRFNWLRDAAFTVQALYKLGHVEEARGYFEWCMSQLPDDGDAARETASAAESVDGVVTSPLFRPLYGLREDARLTETTLDHLEGYRGSSPVRVGNDARKQRQLDLYGELVLAVYAVSKHHEGTSVADANWEGVRTIADHVCDAWEKPDLGIWEVRTEPKQFVHSKVMCWAALDRAIRLVEEGDADGPGDFHGDVSRWKDNRARLRERILEEGYDESRGAFTRTFEGTELDAACLRIPVVGFLPFDDDRVRGTVDAVMDQLATDEGLVYRYQGDDGLPGEENPFVMCSFWLVDALALSGRVAEAQDVFENVLSYASPHGLLAEEVDPDTGELRGNYPQAFSHIGLVNSAVYLRKAMGEPDEGVVGDEASPAVNGEGTRTPPGR